MYNYLSDPTVSDCTFSANTADHGGGMFNHFSSPIATNSMFIENVAVWDGGGLKNNLESNLSATRCSFIFNLAHSGGGMYNHSSSPSLTNCSFTGNQALALGSPTGGGICNVLLSNPEVINGIIWGDYPDEFYNSVTCTTFVEYSDVEGGYPGLGNIDTDPYFVDPMNYDLNLLPNSPCINAGNPYYRAPPGGECVIDMGAYEYWHGISCIRRF